MKYTGNDNYVGKYKRLNFSKQILKVYGGSEKIIQKNYYAIIIGPYAVMHNTLLFLLWLVIYLLEKLKTKK